MVSNRDYLAQRVHSPLPVVRDAETLTEYMAVRQGSSAWAVHLNNFDKRHPQERRPGMPSDLDLSVRVRGSTASMGL